MALYFQVQFLKLKCTEKCQMHNKNALKSETKKKVSSLKKRHYQGPEKKCKELKRDLVEVQSQEDSVGKGNIRKILNKKKNMKKRNRKILSLKKNTNKNRYWENPE